jgi:hypothetical protein
VPGIADVDMGNPIAMRITAWGDRSMDDKPGLVNDGLWMTESERGIAYKPDVLDALER